MCYSMYLYVGVGMAVWHTLLRQKNIYKILISERHNQARDIFQNSEICFNYLHPRKKKAWNPQMKVRKINHLFKEWLSGSMLVFGRVVGVFSPLLWNICSSMLGIISSRVAANVFQHLRNSSVVMISRAKYPTTNHIPNHNPQDATSSSSNPWWYH